MKNTALIAIVVAAVIFGAGGFFAGMKYQQSKMPSGWFGNFQGNGSRQFQQRGGQGFRPVSGEIIGEDDKSITVKLQDGSSKIVLVSEKTSINKASEGTKEDLKEGEKVMVLGQENSDGSVTAQNIQLNPIFRGGSFPSPQP